MADISKVTLPNDQTVYNLKDSVARSDISGKVNKSGDTMTGLLKLKGSQYTDSHTVGGLDANNSNIVGVNGIYFADSSDSSGEAINFYRDATHADSIHAYNGALYFTPNRELGTTGSAKRVLVSGDGSTFPEAYLTWGGKNFSASYGPIDAAMVSELGANRFAFLKPEGVTVEYSRDNGETWVDYGATDNDKASFFGTSYAFTVGKSTNTDANRANANCLLRVTIDTNLGKVYSVLNKFVIYVSTVGSSGCWCSLDAATHGTPDTWVNKFNKVGISGWSGYNVINTGGITTYGNSNSHYQYLRFTFGITSQSSSYAGLQVFNIKAFGGVGWTTPSNMAAKGHLYSYDYAQNATFPAKVTATEFSGIVNATTATGTLPVAHGGTGKTTAVDAANNLIKDLTVGSSDPVDGDTYIASYADGKNTAGTGTNTFHRRPITSLWNYMKSKISTVLGIGGSSGVPTAPTATAGTNNTQIATTAFVHSAVNTAIGGINSFDVEVVQALPTSNIKDHTIYFIRKTGSTNDVYDEYMYINSAWEHIGSTDIDLSGYVPTTRTINSKALSSNITLSASDVGAAKAESVVSSTLAVASWSNGVYSFTSTYPNASYDIAIEPDGNTITDEQYQAWCEANIVGSSAGNVIKALGTVPTVAIPVVIRVMPK